MATQFHNVRSPRRLTVVDGATPSHSVSDLPAGLRIVRAIDRAVLEVARSLDMRPMELYALTLLRETDPLTTAELAERLSASTSQAKQLALRLSARGLASREGSNGLTELTPLGAALAESANRQLERTIESHMAEVDDLTRLAAGATLAALTLPSA